jgi:hypothetical protein
MTKEKLNEIRARLNAATPGPWEWDVNSIHKNALLMTTHSGRYCVMGFERWGTQGAIPVFDVCDKYEGPIRERGSQGMVRADKLLKSMPGKEHHKGFDDYIDHPDADLIANTPSDIKALLEYIEELEGRLNNE